MVTVPVRRRQAVYAHGRGMSLRKAYRLFQIARSGMGYESKLVERRQARPGHDSRARRSLPAFTVAAEYASFSRGSGTR